jgi:tRNA(fMet)-specific endonuclease VapC
MTTRFLLDTNALSQLIRDPRGTVGTRLREVGDSSVFTSIIVACELRYGARKRGSAALMERVEQLLASIDVAPLESGVDALYAEVRHELESQGTPIGASDLLIAAHALEHQATLVTDDVAEFQRVPGLQVENWVRPA